MKSQYENGFSDSRFTTKNSILKPSRSSIIKERKNSIQKFPRSSFIKERTKSIIDLKLIAAIQQDEKYSPVKFYFDQAQKRQLKFRIDRRTKFKQEALDFIINFQQKIKPENQVINSERLGRKSIQQITNFDIPQRTQFVTQSFANHSCECKECGSRSKFQSHVWKEKPLTLTKYQRHKIIYWRLKKIFNAVIFLLRYKLIHNQKLKAKRKILLRALKKNREAINKPSIHQISQKFLKQLASFKAQEIQLGTALGNSHNLLEEDSSGRSSLLQLETEFHQTTMIQVSRKQIQTISDEKPKPFFPHYHQTLFKYVDTKKPKSLCQSRSYLLKPLYQSAQDMQKQKKNHKSVMKSSVVTSINDSLENNQVMNKRQIHTNSDVQLGNRDTTYNKRNFRILLMDMRKRH